MMVNMMDNLALNASSQNKLVSGFTANPRTDATTISNKPLFCSFKIPKRSGAIYKSKSSISTPRAVNKLNGIFVFFQYFNRVLYLFLYMNLKTILSFYFFNFKSG
ncbi:hypothetical protein HanOQP8_Chr02g0044571 [Helianthus annuus]|nr:hypothetical protein HanOQP8_Chr02g0044571 [Helianthus annuus]